LILLILSKNGSILSRDFLSGPCGRRSRRPSAVDIISMERENLPMTKTQIQVPEELFREVRAFSKRREWSLAETFRRGVELLLQVYPEADVAADAVWTPPTSSRVGWKGLTAEQLRDAAFADGEPRLP
jgi:hypothetical protein